MSVCPILFLTARITKDKINGLQAGGDDYITKPFSPEELTARVALTCEGMNEARLRLKSFFPGIDRKSCGNVLAFMGKALNLSNREFDIVEFLMCNVGQIFDRERIL